jgi:hypothetical protein
LHSHTVAWAEPADSASPIAKANTPIANLGHSLPAALVTISTPSSGGRERYQRGDLQVR